MTKSDTFNFPWDELEHRIGGRTYLGIESVNSFPTNSKPHTNIVIRLNTIPITANKLPFNLSLFLRIYTTADTATIIPAKDRKTANSNK